MKPDIESLIAQIITWDLEAPLDFLKSTTGEKAAAYNGIGPDWLPESLRDWMTEQWGFFAAAAMIHDWEYTWTEDRSYASFRAINARFGRNCRTLLKKGVPWYKRPLYLFRADKLEDACNTWGFKGFLDAGDRREKLLANPWDRK